MPSLMRLMLWGSVTSDSLQHCVKRFSPIVTCVPPGTKAALVKFSQLIKAPAPTSVTLAGREMDLRAVQPRNAFWPMASTPPATVTELRFRHVRKAPSPIVFTPAGMAAEMMALP